MATILKRHELPGGGDFQGFLHGGIGSSFIWVETGSGEGPRLHKHPYPEIFIVLEGRARYTVGGESIEAEAGQVLIGPADTPHKFVNLGPGPLRQIDIHANDRFITEWLED